MRVTWAPGLALMAAGWALAVSGEDPARVLRDCQASAFNYVVGAQASSRVPVPQDETRLVETARRIRELGATVIKFELSQRYAGARGNVPPTSSAIRSLAELARDEPSHRQVLDMPFASYVLWAHAFGYSPEQWRKGLAQADAEREYRELHDLAVYLLKAYSGSGKTFFLGHWEGTAGCAAAWRAER